MSFRTTKSSSIALHTDLYQLTMAQGYWKLGMQERQAVFELFFRENPFHGAYAIACGLNDVIHFIKNYSFNEEETLYLASLTAPNGAPLFCEPFLQALKKLKLTIDLEAIEEGTVVFPKEPLLRVQGPLWQCQLLETTLLNIMNFSTLIATKASRVCFAAAGDPVIEFGLRRAQGPDGALMASRAAFVGGVSFTSNVLAGKEYGIPVKGTHAHSWIMAFDTELESFRAYAETSPNNCIFLVDTYKTIEGVKHAIEVGIHLKEKGYPFLGIRLDSGDMVSLSMAARDLLDKAGFNETFILASSDLDEYEIQRLKAQGARIDMWGVGTRLVTGYDQPALGGVYKLVSFQDKDGHWQHKHKESDDPQKRTIPGIHAVRRYVENKNKGKELYEGSYFVKDVMYSIDSSMNQKNRVNTIHKTDPQNKKNFDSQENQQKTEEENTEELLCSIFKAGKLVYSVPHLQAIQKRTFSQLERLPSEFRVLQPLKQYPVELFKEE